MKSLVKSLLYWGEIIGEIITVWASNHWRNHYCMGIKSLAKLLLYWNEIIGEIITLWA